MAQAIAEIPITIPANPKGPWNHKTVYNVNDFVTYDDGFVYISRINNNADTPPPEHANAWSKLGVTGAAGQGVPVGGAIGNVLTKASNEDFDTAWRPPTGGGSDAELGQRVTHAENDVAALQVYGDPASWRPLRPMSTGDLKPPLRVRMAECPQQPCAGTNTHFGFMGETEWGEQISWGISVVEQFLILQVIRGSMEMNYIYVWNDTVYNGAAVTAGWNWYSVSPSTGQTTAGPVPWSAIGTLMATHVFTNGDPLPGGLVEEKTPMLTSRKLTEGTDYEFEQGVVTETSEYWGETIRLRHWNNLHGFSNDPERINWPNIGDGYLWQELWGSRTRFIYPHDLGLLERLQVRFTSGGVQSTADMTVTNVENIYWCDGKTLRTVKVTASGVIIGVTIQIELCIGYNFWSSSGGFGHAFDDMFYSFKLIDIPAGLSPASAMINDLLVTMPTREVIHYNERYARIKLNEKLSLPESVVIRYNATYTSELAGVMRTAEITTHEITDGLIYGENRFVFTCNCPPGLDFNNPKTLNEVAWLEGKVLCRDDMIAFVFPNWNHNMRITNIEILEVYKKEVVT
jgi:hypothetical protein